MLREIPHVRQSAGEERRRWFCSPDMDLIVWSQADGAIGGFQLCYDKTRHERAITWRRDGSYSHGAIDDGEDRPGKYKSTPIVVPDGAPDPVSIAALFKTEAAAIDPAVAAFVFEKLLACPRGVT
jgi:hypothetical protein